MLAHTCITILLIYSLYQLIVTSKRFERLKFINCVTLFTQIKQTKYLPFLTSEMHTYTNWTFPKLQLAGGYQSNETTFLSLLFVCVIPPTPPTAARHLLAWELASKGLNVP